MMTPPTATEKQHAAMQAEIHALQLAIKAVKTLNSAAATNLRPKIAQLMANDALTRCEEAAELLEKMCVEVAQSRIVGALHPVKISDADIRALQARYPTDNDPMAFARALVDLANVRNGP